MTDINYEYKDVKLFLDLDRHGEFFDIELGDDDFVNEDGFENIDLISLFSDRLVSKDEAIDGYRGGWWGCSVMGIDPNKWGSKLWTLRRKKLDNTLIKLWESYCEDAYKWTIDDGIFKSVKCKAWVEKNILYFVITKTKPDDQELVNKYYEVWSKYIGG